MTVFLAFSRPMPLAVFAKEHTATTPHANPRKAHSGAGSANSVQEISRIQARSPVRETSAFALTSASDGGGYWHRGSTNRPWHEMDTTVNHPTVSSVVRDAVTILRPPADHDRVHDRNPRLTH